MLLRDHAGTAAELRLGFATEDGFAAELVRRGWLTPFQGRWVARGHGRRLVVGPYTLLDRLGTGGMGHVFLALHRGLGRKTALKVVRPDRADRHAAAERFAREVRALARLNHENVVHAYDAGTHGRSCYLAMEYVAGTDLARLLRGGPLPPGLACEYARQAALGLGHLHDHGLVHRDVKPANLAVGRSGSVVKVLDVGLVRERVAEDTGLTRVGVFVGTPDYVSPEQVAGVRAVGRRADQYALGCTLFHMLTGRVPFPEGNAVSKAVRRLTEPPPVVNEVRSGLPGGLGLVVGRLLARSPRDRFGCMGEVAATLARFAVPMAIGPDVKVGAASPSTVADLPCLPETLW